MSMSSLNAIKRDRNLYKNNIITIKNTFLYYSHENGKHTIRYCNGAIMHEMNPSIAYIAIYHPTNKLSCICMSDEGFELQHSLNVKISKKHNTEYWEFPKNAMPIKIRSTIVRKDSLLALAKSHIGI